MKKELVIISILTTLLFIIVGSFIYIQKTSTSSVEIASLGDSLSTTTAVVIPSSPLPVSSQEEDWKTYTSKKYGFEFQYPPSRQIVEIKTDGPERVQIRDSIGIFPINRNDNRAIYIYLPISKDVGYNPSATSLEDYETDYDSLYGQVMIHSTERVQVNTIKSIKQIYTAWFWSYDVNGKEIKSFMNNEYDNGNWLRYVFFDKKDNFVILKAYTDSDERMKKLGKQTSEKLLDDIAKTFRFVE